MGALRALCCSKGDRDDDHHTPPSRPVQQQPEKKREEETQERTENVQNSPPETEVIQDKSVPADLWKEAYESLDIERRKYLPTGTSTTDAIDIVIKETTDKHEKWKNGGPRIPLKGGGELNIRDSTEKIIKAAMQAKTTISNFASLDPTGHASSAWMVISFGMSVVGNVSDRRDAIFASSEFLAEQLAYYAVIDTTYRNQDLGIDEDFDNALRRVYSAILDFTAEAKKAQSENTAVLIAKGIFPLTDGSLSQLKTAIDEQNATLARWTQLAANLGDRKIAAAHQAKLESVESQVLTAQEERQLVWMSSASYSDRQRESQKSRTGNTGSWFLDSDEYNHWKSNPGDILWLPGVSGCGKSVLCSTAVRDIEEDCQSHNSKRLAYWYFDFRDEKTQNVDTMTRSLIRQLSRPPLLPSVTRIWEEHSFRGSQPDSKAISNVFDDLISSIIGSVYLVFDALDECPMKERSLLLSLLIRLTGQHKGKVHILATSRPEPDIKEELEIFSRVDLETCLTEDVHTFVSMSISQAPLKRWRDEIKELIMNRLLGSKERRFRWAELQIFELEKCRNEAHVKNALDTIPETLEKTYRKILDGFESRDVPLARQILIIICLSPDPLDLITLAAMVDLDPAAVLEICTTSLVSEFHGKVGIAHFSVQEFLIVSEEDGQHHECQFLASDGHKFLATKTVNCLLEQTTFLTEGETDSKKTLPLFYAAKYWNTHVAALGDIDQLHPDLEAKINRLFTEPSIYCIWVRMANGDFSDVETGLSGLSQVYTPPICQASMMGFFKPVEALLKQGADPNVKTGLEFCDSALQAASNWGHEKIVKILLDHGADIEAQGDHSGNALQLASYQGHEKIVQMLLDRGADIEAQGYRLGNALQAASRQGHEKIVQMLLDRGADIEAQGRRFGTALQAASLSGHEKVVQMLLDRGANMEAQGGEFRTALKAASYRGHENIVQMLLERGAVPLAH